MAVRINDIAPDFTAESTAGTIRFHDWLGDSYGIIFSHPRDFTSPTAHREAETAKAHRG